MKGINTIEMNEVTIVEAIQEYLDKRWTGTVLTVKSIKPTTRQRNDTYSMTYEVVVECEKSNA